MASSQLVTHSGKQLMKEEAFEIYVDEVDFLIKAHEVTPCVGGVTLNGVIVIVNHKNKEVFVKKSFKMAEPVWNRRLRATPEQVNHLMISKLSY